MRHLVSMLALLGLLIAGVPVARAAAQNASMLELLPSANDIGPDFVVADNRTRTLAEQATGFANADEAARLLAGWNWQENGFAVFQAPSATIDISLTRFADADGASLAMPYFIQDRAAVLGQREVQDLSEEAIGDESRTLIGAVEGGFDATLYVRSGVLLMRISATSTAEESVIAPAEIAQGIIDRDAPHRPSSTMMQLATSALSETLPLDYADCFSIEGEGELDLPGIMERLASDADISTALDEFGWRGGDYRQFSCKPPPGRLGWVDISLHRFTDANAAAEAVTMFAESRSRGMHLQPAPVVGLGDSYAAIAGPAVNGTEYTLYVSSGAQLFAVTGVAPAGTSDPRSDVEAIAAALLAPTTPAQTGEVATAVPAAPTVPPIPTSTPFPTTIPVPTATTTIPQPTPAPVATATRVPLRAAIPTSTPIPTFSPPPTEVPTPMPDTIPVEIPAQPTATSGPLPTATPRVIRPPTPGAG